MQRDLISAFSERAQRRAERAERLRRLDTDLDWRSWIRHRLAAYWYGVLAAFADVAVVASVFSVLPRPAGPATYGIALVAVAPVAYLEWELYRILWPEDDEVLESLERKAEANRAAAAARAAVRIDREGERPPGREGGSRET